MAKPIDPKRWDEFAIQGPIETMHGDGASNSVSQTTGQSLPSVAAPPGLFREVDTICQLASTTPMPIPAVTALIVALATGPSAGSGTSDLAKVRVDFDGATVWPEGACVDGASLIALLRVLVSDQSVPPAVARLLLVQPEPKPNEIVRTLEALADPLGLVAYLALDDVSSPGSLQTSNTSFRVDDSAPVSEPIGRSRLASPRADRQERDLSRGQRRSHSRGQTTKSQVSTSDSSAWRRLPRPWRAHGRVLALAMAGIGGLAVLLVLFSPSEQVDPIRADGASAPPPSASGVLPTSASTVPRSDPASADAASADAASTDAEVDSATVASLPTSWVAHLGELDVVRAAAFADDNAGSLSEVNAPGSPAQQRDLATLATLRSVGVTARNLRTTIIGVQVRQQAQQRVRLLVRDRRDAYQLVSKSSGDIVERRRAAGQGRWSVELRNVEGRWLIEDVAAA